MPPISKVFKFLEKIPKFNNNCDCRKYFEDIENRELVEEVKKDFTRVSTIKDENEILIFDEKFGRIYRLKRDGYNLLLESV